MGLFSKAPEEHFSVLQHYFDVDEIAFRYPEQNFLSGSVLFVQPGQEAVLIKEGDLDGPYTNGRYVLDVNQLPKLRKFFNKGYGANGAFNCYLYFINKDKPVNVFWGTDHHIKVRDPHTGRLVRMFGRGSFALTISDSMKFIGKLNGQLASFNSEDLDEFLFNKSIERIISNISTTLQRERISFIEIESHLGEISDKIKAQLIAEKLFDNYGLNLAEFAIRTIDINEEDFAELQKEENDLERRRREVELEAMQIRAKGFAESDVMKEKGIYYDKERGYDVLQAAASNEGGLGGNGFVGAGIGLGVGLNAGAGFGAAIGNMAMNTFATQQAPAVHTGQSDGLICPQCNAKNMADAKFCHECGSGLAPKAVICPSCQAENSANAKFCNNCGTPLAKKKAFCKECGAENEGNAKFCQSCGSKLGE